MLGRLKDIVLSVSMLRFQYSIIIITINETKCVYLIQENVYIKTAANSDIKIPLLDSDSLFQPAIFGKEYQA